MSVVTSKELKIPVVGKRLSDFSHGEIVKLNENGTPVEFYVAKHDYESGLNGAGRTLLVRKDGYDTRKYDSGYDAEYSRCDLDAWLNSTYKALLDVDVQVAIDTTSFYYNLPASLTISTLQRSVFILSITEFGKYHAYKADAGTKLPISDILAIVYVNGTATMQWTRSAVTNDEYSVIRIESNGTSTVASSTGASCASRPCFTLPADTLFDPNTLLFKGVV